MVNGGKDTWVNSSDSGLVAAVVLQNMLVWTTEEENGTSYTLYKSDILDQEGNHTELLMQRTKRVTDGHLGPTPTQLQS